MFYDRAKWNLDLYAPANGDVSGYKERHNVPVSCSRPMTRSDWNYDPNSKSKTVLRSRVLTRFASVTVGIVRSMQLIVFWFQRFYRTVLVYAAEEATCTNHRPEVFSVNSHFKNLLPVASLVSGSKKRTVTAFGRGDAGTQSLRHPTHGLIRTTVRS